MWDSWTWLREHAQVIASLGTLGMLLVWLVYLHLIYRSYRQQRRTRMIIHQGQGDHAGAACLLINMSPGVVHVASVMVAGHGATRRVVREVTDERRFTLEDESSKRTERVMKQGPLASGEFLSLGRFDDLLERVQPEDEALEEIEVRAVLMHSATEQPVGVRRRFRLVEADGHERVHPVTWSTEQLTGWRQRRTVRRWLEQSMQPMVRGR